MTLSFTRGGVTPEVQSSTFTVLDLWLPKRIHMSRSTAQVFGTSEVTYAACVKGVIPLFPGQSYLRRTNQGTMAQDPQAQAIRKRKATLKIARLKAASEGAPAKASTRKGTAAKKAAK